MAKRNALLKAAHHRGIPYGTRPDGMFFNWICHKDTAIQIAGLRCVCIEIIDPHNDVLLIVSEFLSENIDASDVFRIVLYTDPDTDIISGIQLQVLKYNVRQL